MPHFLKPEAIRMHKEALGLKLRGGPAFREWCLIRGIKESQAADDMGVKRDALYTFCRGSGVFSSENERKLLAYTGCDSLNGLIQTVEKEKEEARAAAVRIAEEARETQETALLQKMLYLEKAGKAVLSLLRHESISLQDAEKHLRVQGGALKKLSQGNNHALTREKLEKLPRTLFGKYGCETLDDVIKAAAALPPPAPLPPCEPLPPQEPWHDAPARILGPDLWCLRNAMRMTQEDVAKCLHVAQTIVSKFENGFEHHLSKEKIAKLPEVFGLINMEEFQDMAARVRPHITQNNPWAVKLVPSGRVVAEGLRRTLKIQETDRGI